MKVVSSCNNNNYNQSFFQTKGKWGQESETFSSVLSRSLNTRYYKQTLQSDDVCQLREKPTRATKTKKVWRVPFLKSPSRKAKDIELQCNVNTSIYVAFFSTSVGNICIPIHVLQVAIEMYTKTYTDLHMKGISGFRREVDNFVRLNP